MSRVRAASPARPRPAPAPPSILRSEYLVLLLCVVYFLALLPFTPGLAAAGEPRQPSATLLPLFVVADGPDVVLITGGIDLSLTSIIALTSVVGAAVMNGERRLAGGSSARRPGGHRCHAAGRRGRGPAQRRWPSPGFSMPPFIVTLTSMMFFSGLAIWLTQSRNIDNLPAAFRRLGGKTGIGPRRWRWPLAVGAHTCC